MGGEVLGGHPPLLFINGKLEAVRYFFETPSLRAGAANAFLSPHPTSSLVSAPASIRAPDVEGLGDSRLYIPALRWVLPGGMSGFLVLKVWP